MRDQNGAPGAQAPIGNFAPCASALSIRSMVSGFFLANLSTSQNQFRPLASGAVAASLAAAAALFTAPPALVETLGMAGARAVSSSATSPNVFKSRSNPCGSLLPASLDASLTAAEPPLTAAANGRPSASSTAPPPWRTARFASLRTGILPTNGATVSSLGPYGPAKAPAAALKMCDRADGTGAGL